MKRKNVLFKLVNALYNQLGHLKRTNLLKYYKTVIPTHFIMLFLPSLCTAGLLAGTWTIHTKSIHIYNVVVADSVAWLNGLEYLNDGSQRSGLFRYDLLNNTYEFFPDKAFRNYLVKNSIALDYEGRLITFYINDFPDGPCTVYRYDNESWETIYGPIHYQNIITSIFTDFNGGIWGTYVAPHSNDRIIRINGNTGEYKFLDWAYFWAGFVSRYSPYTAYLSVTGGDLFSADPSSWEGDWTFHDNPFENQYINIITVDQSGNVWFGNDGKLEFTTPYGVVRYDGTNWDSFTKNENKLASDTISALNVDSSVRLT